MRTTARETTFKIIFASQFTQSIDDELKRALFKVDKLNNEDMTYSEAILDIVKKHGDEIAEIIDNHSRLFPESRLFPADRSVLYLSLAEILYYGEVPPAVSANEGANIASKYSSEKSASFISGILAEIIREKKNV